MSYAIIGTGGVGRALDGFFQKAGVEVLLANSRGAEAAKPIAAEIGDHVKPVSSDEALNADVIFVATKFIDFKKVGALRPDWTGKIVVDPTNASYLPPEVQEQELQGRPSSVVNAERVPGAKLVKSFNQHPVKWLAGDPPASTKRVNFVSSDDADASATVAKLFEQLGFASVEVGPLAEGGVLIQSKAPLAAQNFLKPAA